MAIESFRSQHPELDPVFEWPGWQRSQYSRRRLLIAEVCAVLRKHGPITNSHNGLRDMQALLEREGSLVIGEMSGTGFPAFLRDIDEATLPDGRGTESKQKFIHREMAGKRTSAIHLIDGIDLPPDPFELRRASEGAVSGAQLARSEGERLLERFGIRRPADDGEGIDDEDDGVVIDVMAEPEPEPEPDPEPEEPFVLPASPAAALVDLSERSASENARLALHTVGDLLSQVYAMEAALDRPAADESDDVKERLADVLAECDRLRQKLTRETTQKNMAQAQVRATEAALRAEREKVVALEGNVERLLRGERVPNESGFRELRKLIQERPRVSA